MSILEDYDHDYDIIKETEDEALALANAYTVTKTHGADSSSVMILKAHGLLAHVSQSSMALESLTSLQKQRFALEAIGEAMKKKMDEWSVKLTSFFKEAPKKTIESLKGLLERLKKLSVDLKDKVLSAKDLSATYIKTHPYKSIAAAIVASLAVVGIFKYVIGHIPSPKEADKLNEVMNTTVSMIDKVDHPFKTVKSAISSNGKKITLAIGATGAVAGVATITSLGWTKSAVDLVAGQCVKIGSGIASLLPVVSEKATHAAKESWSLIKGVGYAISEGSKLGDDGYEQQSASSAIGGALLMGFIVGVTSLIYVLFKLMKAIVIGSLKLIGAVWTRLFDGGPKTNYI